MPEQNEIHHLTKGSIAECRNHQLFPNVTIIKDDVLVKNIITV